MPFTRSPHEVDAHLRDPRDIGDPHQRERVEPTLRTRRRAARFVAAFAVAGALAPGVASASTVQGVHLVEGHSLFDSDGFKPARAYCAADERVIGGGARIYEENGGVNAALTGLRPVRLIDQGTRDAYVVTAAETTTGTTGRWLVEAYAMCAKPIPGLHIVPSLATPPSSQPMQATAAACPAGEVVIGSGGTVSAGAEGQVVLQGARPSHPGDIARVQAHEDATGYSLFWSTTAYAVCAPRPDGYEEVAFAESLSRHSESPKNAGLAAGDGCPIGKQLLSSGAAVTSAAPGNVSLRTVLPLTGRTFATAVENTPTDDDWDFIVATSVCAL
jgi:hypothetical protein